MVAFCARHGFIIMEVSVDTRQLFFSNLAGGTVEHIGIHKSRTSTENSIANRYF